MTTIIFHFMNVFCFVVNSVHYTMQIHHFIYCKKQIFCCKMKTNGL